MTVSVLTLVSIGKCTKKSVLVSPVDHGTGFTGYLPGGHLARSWLT